ncbi:MAG: 4-alpha-glucanotransferase [Myxococcaceae bacterium]
MSTPTGRISGILLPLFSLRSRDDFGIGDFGAVDGLLQWMAAAKQKLLMVLPLLPTAPGDPSPYSTRSAFGLNSLFIDLKQVPEFVEAGGMNSLSADEKRMLEEARKSHRIHYGQVFPLKGAALRRAFDRFEANHFTKNTDRAKAFEAWRQSEGIWLDSFALYTAISESQERRAWWEWPEPLRDRKPEALNAERERLKREILFHTFLQWIAHEQWNRVRESAKSRGVLLCGDEPFIIGQDSVDTWCNPTVLRRDARLGVPPDDFSATGQDWGLPYFDFQQMAKDDYSWLRFRAKKAASYYDLRRVDHAVGYFRQWIRDEKTPTGRFIPEGEAAHKETGRKNFEILGSDAAVVAEDLGVIPDFVREMLTQMNIPGYRVMRWERDEAVYRDPRKYPVKSLVTTGTHDTETLAEWWEAEKDETRLGVAKVYPELKELNPPQKSFTPRIHEALISAALNSASELCVLPWQDVFGSRERVNLPGSMQDANWAYRIDMPVEELLQRKDTKERAEWLGRLTAQSSR